MRGSGLALTAAVLVGGCSLPGHSASPKATTPVATTTPGTTAAAATTTIPGIQTTGTRTVLSPIGLNVRDQPATTGKVVGTAAQGATLAVVGYSLAAGGWYQVRGATVTGWITARAGLSAPGDFKGYTSAPLAFTALYPAGWTVKESPTSTAFVAPGATESITVVTGANLAALPKGLPGYVLSHSEQIVVCGLTSYLDSYTAPAPGSPYVAQINLPLDATHALGIEGSLAGAAQLGDVRTFAATVSFPYPACEGG